jgi:hypothetical protein
VSVPEGDSPAIRSYFCLDWLKSNCGCFLPRIPQGDGSITSTWYNLTWTWTATLGTGSIDCIDYFMMCLDLPKDFLFLEVEDVEFAFQVPESETCVGCGTGCESAWLYSSWVLDCGQHLQLTLGQLCYLDKSCCLGALPTRYKLRSLWNPLDLIRSVIHRSAQMLHYLRGLDCVHRFERV